MKRICLVFLLMFAAMTLVAQVSNTSHPLLSAVYLIDDKGDTLESEIFKYDELDRCVQIVTQTWEYKLLQSIIYPDNRTVVVNSTNEYSKSVTIYELNEAGQALTCSLINLTDEVTDTVVSRIFHLASGFTVNLNDYGLENMTDEELELEEVDPEEFIAVSEGNIIGNSAGSTYDHYTNQHNTIGMLNQGIYFLGADNKNPVKSVTVVEEDEFGDSYENTYIFEYVFDDQGRIIKQKYASDDSIYKSFEYVNK